jgi:hypothetical protein
MNSAHNSRDLMDLLQRTGMCNCRRGCMYTYLTLASCCCMADLSREDTSEKEAEEKPRFNRRCLSRFLAKK